MQVPYKFNLYGTCMRPKHLYKLNLYSEKMAKLIQVQPLTQAPHNSTVASSGSTRATYNSTVASTDSTQAPYNSTEASTDSTQAPHNSTVATSDSNQATHIIQL